MVRSAIVVRAAVVDVLANAAVPELAPDALPGHREAAVRAAQQAYAALVGAGRRPPVLAVEEVLADLEGRAVDQELVLASVDAAIAYQLADVEAVVQDVGEPGAIEAWLARAIDEALLRELARDPLERELAAR